MLVVRDPPSFTELIYGPVVEHNRWKVHLVDEGLSDRKVLRDLT
jgi:hypothetical protein